VLFRTHLNEISANSLHKTKDHIQDCWNVIHPTTYIHCNPALVIFLYLLDVLNVPGSEFTVSRPCKQPVLLIQQDHSPNLQRSDKVALYFNTN